MLCRRPSFKDRGLTAAYVQVFGRRQDALSTRSCGRRPKAPRHETGDRDALRRRLQLKRIVHLTMRR
jgi:hypothetical protein